jgi:hypothetical protein
MIYADKIVVEVNGQEIAEVASVEFKDDLKAEAVPTMNSQNKALGYRAGVPAYDLTIEVIVPNDGDEYDWNSLAPKGDTFNVIGICGAKRETYGPCFVKTIGKKGAVNSNVTRSLDIGALDHKVN